MNLEFEFASLTQCCYKCMSVAAFGPGLSVFLATSCLKLAWKPAPSDSRKNSGSEVSHLVQYKKQSVSEANLLFLDTRLLSPFPAYPSLSLGLHLASSQ